MPGGWQTYHCDRCPLYIELGGVIVEDDAWAVSSETVQVACRACGTMHRVTDEYGESRVTALPGPVREVSTETLEVADREAVEMPVWVAEADWRPAGQHPRGIAGFADLRCRHCGLISGMLTLGGFRLPFKVAVAGGREECPVCRGPMPCIGVSDAI